MLRNERLDGSDEARVTKCCHVIVAFDDVDFEIRHLVCSNGKCRPVRVVLADDPETEHQIRL